MNCNQCLLWLFSFTFWLNFRWLSQVEFRLSGVRVYVTLIKIATQNVTKSNLITAIEINDRDTGALHRLIIRIAKKLTHNKINFISDTS